MTLIVRHGIEKNSAPPGVLAKMPAPYVASCDLHLKRGVPVIPATAELEGTRLA